MEEQIKQFDVVQIQPGNVPTEYVGCLAYVMDTTAPTVAGSDEPKFIVRFYLPKTRGENAEFTECSIDGKDLFRVGTVPEEMRPL